MTRQGTAEFDRRRPRGIEVEFGKAPIQNTARHPKSVSILGLAIERLFRGGLQCQ